ncbi:hypothetical protein THASP1DRAFT_25755 [Thamnocephalis sphaerospora]|uniref:Uncharacterized protein n=1 Tax=Thamnocephalis sphaerospora TaxID=78915 RepID=A0A4P9XJ87_9FUNG|nr:hypothetical protein THASP1DRAFT_25755 [Thamnocephalis sphaerospora]|eukprot:RKP05814.1 hypothetical protein THASP1DRAFT_25755 [Thamnocephalis sphaerospora]
MAQQPLRLWLPRSEQSREPDESTPLDAPRHFIAMLAAGQLPTLSRNARWYRETFGHDRCRRCLESEETWEHIVACRRNEPNVDEQVAAACREAVNRALEKQSRTEMRSILRQLPLDTISSDSSLFIGSPSPQYTQAVESLRPHVARSVLNSLIQAARHKVFTTIWKPRCHQTRQLLEAEGITWSRTRGWRRNSPVEDIEPPTEMAAPIARSQARTTRERYHEANQLAFQMNRYPAHDPRWA